MTPFASVAILEKLALLKIALCRAPALSSASSACLRAVLLLAVVPRESRLRRLGSRRIRLVMGCPLGVRGALAPNAAFSMLSKRFGPLSSGTGVYAEAKLFIRYCCQEGTSAFPETSADEVRYLIKITSF